MPVVVGEPAEIGGVATLPTGITVIVTVASPSVTVLVANL